MQEDKTERSKKLEQGAEETVLNSADAQAARNASAADVSEVQETNPNKFESMTQLPTIKHGRSLAEAEAEYQSFGINMTDGSAVTGTGVESAVIKKKVSVDPCPSYVEGLKAVGNDDESQGRFSIAYMERKGREALSALKKGTKEQVLIASNITPEAPNLEQMQQYPEVLRDMPPEDFIAWDPREWAGYQLKEAERQTKKTVQSVGRAAKYGEATAKHPDLQVQEEPPKGGDYWHPHRGREDDFISYPACAAASMPFENIRLRIGDGPGHIDPDLIAAMMRNEQHYYKQIGDVGQDNYVRIHGNLDILNDDTYSIGPAQIQIRNVHRLLKQFPEQLGRYKEDPLRAVERPGDAPMFVAAYMSNVIKHLENRTNPGFSSGVWNNIVKHWKEGDANGALILSFNPDPKQIENVSKQLQIIKSAKEKAD